MHGQATSFDGVGHLNPRALRTAAVWFATAFIMLYLASWIGLLFRAHGLAVTWPASGVLIGLLFVSHGINRIAISAAAVIALFLSSYLGGRAFLQSGFLSITTIAECVGILLLIERFSGRPFTLRGMSAKGNFFVVTIVVVGLTGVVVAFASPWAGQPVDALRIDLWWTWFASHVSGILSLAPAIVIGARALPWQVTSRVQHVVEWTMQQRLALLAIVPVLPFSLLSVGAVSYVGDTALRSNNAALLQNARSLASGVEGYIAKYQAIGFALASSPELLEGRLDAFDAVARRTIAAVGDSDAWVIVADPDGQQLFNLVGRPGVALQRRAPVAMLAHNEALATRRPVVAGVLPGLAPSYSTTAINIPIISDGVPRYVLAIGFHVSVFNPLIDANLPSGWISGLIDRDGRFVARSMENDTFVGRQGAPSWLAQRSIEGTFPSRTLEGNAVTTANVPLSFGWAVAVAAKESAVMGTAWATASWVALIGSGLSLLALIAAFDNSRRIAEPAVELTERAAALVAGMPVTFKSGVPELDAIWRAVQNGVVAKAEIDQALKRSEARGAMALQAGCIGVYEYDAVSHEITWDSTVRGFWGITADEPITHDTLKSGLHPDDVTAVESAIAGALDADGDGGFALEHRIIDRSSGEVRWIAVTGKTVFESGKPIRLVGTMLDITRRKASEARISYLVREVNHRSKNILAIVQSIARQTAKRDPKAFVEQFARRIQSLAKSHELLLETDWTGVDIKALAQSQLMPFMRHGSSISITGPPIQLAADAAQSLGMVFHELATNAAKYGALSINSGQVGIDWGLATSPAGQALVIAWIERGGPPTFEPTSNALGFGTTILGELMKVSLDADVRFVYDPKGFEWHAEIPLARLCDATVS